MSGASGECTIEDFPSPGESATFEWNQETQSLLATAWDAGDADIYGGEQRHCVSEDVLTGSLQYCQMVSSDLPVGIDEILADMDRSDSYSLIREQGSSLNRLIWDYGFSHAQVGYIVGAHLSFQGGCLGGRDQLTIRSGSCPSGGFACQFTTDPRVLRGRPAEERREIEEVRTWSLPESIPVWRFRSGI